MDDDFAEWLYDSYGPPLLRYAMRLEPVFEDAEDLVADLFTKLAQRGLAADVVADPSRLRPYLFQVLRNLFRDGKRRRGIETVPSENLELADPLSCSAIDEMVAREDSADRRRRIEGLPVDESRIRAVVGLCGFARAWRNRKSGPDGQPRADSKLEGFVFWVLVRGWTRMAEATRELVMGFFQQRDIQRRGRVSGQLTQWIEEDYPTAFAEFVVAWRMRFGRPFGE